MIEIEDLEVSNASFTSFFRQILNRFEGYRFKSIQNLSKKRLITPTKGSKFIIAVGLIINVQSRCICIILVRTNFIFKKSRGLRH